MSVEVTVIQNDEPGLAGFCKKQVFVIKITKISKTHFYQPSRQKLCTFKAMLFMQCFVPTGKADSTGANQSAL